MKDIRPKSTDSDKIIRYFSRKDEFERNGGGQWVSKHKVHKNKKKYDRKRDKKDLRNELGKSFFVFIAVSLVWWLIFFPSILKSHCQLQAT